MSIRQHEPLRNSFLRLSHALSPHCNPSIPKADMANEDRPLSGSFGTAFCQDWIWECVQYLRRTNLFNRIYAWR